MNVFKGGFEQRFWHRVQSLPAEANAQSGGLLVGLSSGAVFRAYEKIAGEPGEKTYVLVFPDDGFKYVEVFENHLGMT